MTGFGRHRRRTGMGSSPTLLRLVSILPLVLLLVGAQFVGGEHLHVGPGAENCPVCVHAQTPAIGAAPQPEAPAPSVSTQRPHVAPALTPVERAPRTTPSRGPPRA